MTPEQTADVLSMVRLWWPHSDVDSGDVDGTAKAWHAALERYGREEVEQAVRRLLASGREHAPGVGVIVARIEHERQGEPPSFDEAQSFIARHISALPYSSSGYQAPSETVEAIVRLAERGAHEVVLRLVAALGIYAVRMMPDASLQPLDLNQRAVRRDRERDYRERIVAEWRSSPVRGLALARAERKAAREGDGTLRPLDPAAVLALNEERR